MSDKRMRRRLVRVRLVQDGETVADSHPDWAVTTPGDWQCDGYTGVVDVLRSTARMYHGSSIITGLDDDTMQRRIKSLRVKMARRVDKAAAVAWTVPYSAGDDEHLAVVTVL